MKSIYGDGSVSGDSVAVPPAPPAPPPPPPAFTSWSVLSPFDHATFDFQYWGERYEQPIHSASIISTSKWSPEEFLSARYDSSKALALLLQPDVAGERLFASSASGSLRTLASIGEPAIDFGSTPLTPFFGLQVTNPFTSIPHTDAIALVANPYGLGWNYQSFGVWNNHGAGNRDITVSSFGTATPASAVPAVGSASFTGKLAGLYVGPNLQGSMATANVAVAADFSSRSLGFVSSGTTITRDLASSTAAPNLNLSGTLTYSPGSNQFRGTITSAGGTMSGFAKGLFYGPAAQEVGGVFSVKSSTTVETFTGAYGAKR